MFAKLVGEGYERPNADNEVPLDVNYAKVTEWLTDRKLIPPQDWTRKLQVIQAKAADAAKELPPGFLSQFNCGEDSSIDYFLAKQILEKLTETADRGLLGSLKGSAGAWERIIKAYETQLLHVAEGGLTLARNVDYEIPFFKKQAAKNQQLMADFDRKIADSLKSAAAAAAEFKQEIIEMGISEEQQHSSSSSSATTTTTAGLKKALLGLTRDLPQLMGTAVDAAKTESIGNAAKYYAAFTKSILPPSPSSSSPQADVDDLLTVLAEVREGLTLPPDASLFPVESVTPTNEGGQSIDWGAAAADGDDDALVEIDIDTSGVDSMMDWDVSGIVVEDLYDDIDIVGDDGVGATDAVEISWDIDVVVSGADEGEEDGEERAAAENEDFEGNDLTTETEPSPPSAVDALRSASPEISRLVIDSEYRAKLLDNLFELRAFLMQRVNELTIDNRTLMAAAPPEISSVDKRDAAAMQTAVDTAIEAFTEARIMQLLALSSSDSRFCDRLASKLARQGGQEGKFKEAAAHAEARKSEAQRQLVSDSTKLSALVRRTRDVKEGVEGALSLKFGGRKVNVFGEINSVLSAS